MTYQVKNVLCYLYSQYGNHVLSGQQETSWSNPAGDISWYTNNRMKPPAILGGDFLYHDGGSCTTKTATTQRAIDYWNAGGLTMLRYHMGLPASGLTCNDDCYQGTNCSEPTNGAPSASFFTNVITAGTPENTSLNAKLDYVAVQIKALADAKVPVILAMYHETQSDGWFWWAMTTSGSSFVNLWKYTFDYLTKTKSLTNLIWLMPFSGSVPSAFYPGKDYLDIAGPDTYDTNQPFASLYSSAKGVIGGALPIPLHETGSIPTPSAMFPSAAPWVLFNVWATYQSDGSHNTLANIESVYADSHLVTRDEIPNLK
jgi:beta-mannanase